LRLREYITYAGNVTLYTHSQINGTNSEITVPWIFRAKTDVKILYYCIFLRSPSRPQSEKSEIEFEIGKGKGDSPHLIRGGQFR